MILLKYKILFFSLGFTFYCKPTDALFASCNFDDDFCGLIPNEFMVRWTGMSPSKASGPRADKTTGDYGYYALCDARYLTDPSYKCTLKQSVDTDIELSFSFWYYMYGTQIGTLELSTIEEDLSNNGTENRQIIWSLSGRQRDEWLLANVLLPVGNYTLEFSANRSSSGRISSDIAIDDISIQGNELTTKLITQTRSSQASINVPPNVCNLDTYSNTCGWYSDYSNNQWIQTNGNMSDFQNLFGPASDYTSIVVSTLYDNGAYSPDEIYCSIPYCVKTFDPNDVNNSELKTNYYCKKEFLKKFPVCGSSKCPTLTESSTSYRCKLGYYIMITSDKFNTELGQFKSRLISPIYSTPEYALRNSNNNGINLCFKFAYNIYSKNKNDNDGFNVYIENYSNSNEITLINTKRGPLSENRWYWNVLQINLASNYQYRFIIEPIKGNEKDSYSSISIDSLSFDFDICEQETTTTKSTFTTTTTTSTSTTPSSSSTSLQSITTTSRTSSSKLNSTRSTSTSFIANTTQYIEPVPQPTTNIFLHVVVPILAGVVFIVLIIGVLYYLKTKHIIFAKGSFRPVSFSQLHKSSSEINFSKDPNEISID